MENARLVVARNLDGWAKGRADAQSAAPSIRFVSGGPIDRGFMRFPLMETGAHGFRVGQGSASPPRTLAGSSGSRRTTSTSGGRLARRGVDIEKLTERAMAFRVAVPSWGVGTGGTRFARFPNPGEPRNVFEKLEDCQVILELMRTTPGISLHIPWDKPDKPAELRAFAQERGLFIDSMNSNTFEDQPDQPLSYKFGSLSHTDPAVRRQAVEHNLECLELGKKLGARSHTVWVGDGGNFPGPDPHAQGPRALPRQRAPDLSRPARGLASSSSSTSSTSRPSTRPSSRTGARATTACASSGSGPSPWSTSGTMPPTSTSR